MSAPFARLESRLNAAVLGKLANAVAIVNGTKEVKGVFDQPYAEAQGFVAGSSPTFLCAQTEGVVRGNELQIGDAFYTVVNSEPDGTGMVLHQLESQ